MANNHPKRPAKNAAGDEYAAFSDALKKVLSVSHTQLKSHLEREKNGTQAKRGMVVTVSFQSKNGLVREEVDAVARTMARKVADKVREVPYADFGPENTTVKL